MHRLFAIVLLAIALLTDVCAPSGIPTTKVASCFPVRLVRPFIESRLLRTHHEERSNEERGVPVSTVEKIMSLFTAAKVSDETLQLWLKSGKSADNVFIRLKLNTASDKLFENPQFSAWIKYGDELYTKTPQKGVSTISTLTSYYGNQALSQMILAAQKTPSTTSLATELQARQLKYWLSDKTTPADVFKLLMLNKAGDKLVENPQFLTWLAYAADFYKIRRKTQSRIRF
ncbi:hypothetical protein V7S43_017462 [Phytophthora oleae]|uniref:RxLR effector PexRD54 WY domain-containing protein n=1 Tax=Phytophthora oleae TaxID=2107226 RepID=A0ABD3ET24_9STRA